VAVVGCMVVGGLTATWRWLFVRPDRGPALGSQASARARRVGGWLAVKSVALEV